VASWSHLADGYDDHEQRHPWGSPANREGRHELPRRTDV
jgi:hypothetical protein